MTRPHSDGDMPSFHDIYRRGRGERSPAIPPAMVRLAIMALAPQRSRDQASLGGGMVVR